MKSRLATIAIAAGLIAAACTKPDAAPSTDSAARADSMANMPGMGASSGGAMAMAQALEAQMKAAKGVLPDSLRALLPGHRQATANLIAAFGKEMRDMNMAADAAWTATVDSLRNDLRTMPDLDAASLQSLMPRHEARVTRLIQMHETMMKNMKI
jgi:hypothetical protein